MTFRARHIFSPQPVRYKHVAHTRQVYRTGTWGHESRGADFSGWSVRLSAAGAALGVIIALSWTMVYVTQASDEQGQDPQRSSGLPASAVGEGGSLGSVPTDQVNRSESESNTRAADPVQGPALTVPEEMVAMFQQRKQDLDRRENAVRAAEAQLAILKAEVEKILSKVEAVEQRRLAQENPAAPHQASQGSHPPDTRAQQLGQLVKMYESMPAEEAAERIERMTNRKALEILRLLKSKAAGAILAQVKVDRAAKLSEEFITSP
jgi:flagellar motility protein MotE (MotC chaperone)